MNKKILILLLAISNTTVSAQNEIDALRYSTNNILGSARYSAMGGAFGSLGGEFSSLSTNPAGLGMYEFSEFTFTPNINLNNRTSYHNNKLAAYRSGMNIGSLGIVASTPKENSNWKRINVGIGWNQLANYNITTEIEGYSNTSIVNAFIDEATGVLIEDLSIHNNPNLEMAWHTHLIDPMYLNDTVLQNGQYQSNFSSESKRQSKYIESSGSMNEFLLSIATSYKDKLYLGATLGVNTINYYEYSEYSESERTDTTNDLRGMVLSEEVSAYGIGYNLKIGAIYRISKNTKIGGAIHTPKFFNIEENYNTSMATFFKDSTRSYWLGYPTPFTYYLVTPLKAIISASTIFNNNILISAEYEMIDYSLAQYLSSGFDSENQIISETYQKAGNIKLGTEINLNPFLLRAGYTRYGNASADLDKTADRYSFGLGINSNTYFFDLAYILSQSKEEHLLYINTDPITLIDSQHSIRFTVGFRY